MNWRIKIFVAANEKLSECNIEITGQIFKKKHQRKIYDLLRSTCNTSVKLIINAYFRSISICMHLEDHLTLVLTLDINFMILDINFPQLKYSGWGVKS